MNKKIIFPLQLRLLLAFVGVALVAILSIVIYVSFNSERQLNYFVSHGGQYGMDGLTESLAKYFDETGSWEGVDSVFSDTIRGNGRGGHGMGVQSQYALADSRGMIVWSNSDYQDGEMLSTTDQSSSITLTSADSRTIGFLYIQGMNMLTVSDISPFVERLRIVLIWAGGAAIILALLLAFMFSGYLSKPIKELTSATSDLASGNMKTRVNVKGNDEISHLGESFNRMAEQLETAERLKKAMTADIAHELRTPIAVQKAQLEAMIDGLLPVDKENLSTVAEQTDFLTRMVDDLRTLALVDAGELPLENQSINIGEWLPRIVDRFRPQASVNHMSVQLTAQPNIRDAQIHVDPDRLAQIIQNLVSNAVRYGKKDGVIDIDLSRDNRSIKIAIHDDGKGISQSGLEHIFERFYRDDPSRSKETGGTGLGLSISLKLAQMMNGTITVGNHPEGGAVFTIVLPIEK